MQQFYECRIASLERYVGFCVMFHAMAESSRSPWLHLPWNTARSQSNLRVATTGTHTPRREDRDTTLHLRYLPRRKIELIFIDMT